MATYTPPKRATAWVGYIALPSQATAFAMQSNPTIAAGDFKVSKDGGALANLTTLPAVTPASSKMVKIDLSATEMTADNVTVVCSDAAGAEWADLVFNLQTAARQIDDLAFPATSGRSMVVDAAGLVDATAVKVGPTGSGTAQTARDIGASVLLSSGTGTGQIKIASGYVAMTWADIAAPTTAVGLTGTTIATSQVVASVSGAVGSVTGAVGSVTGAVASVTGNVGGNVTGSVGSVVGAVGSVTGAVGSVTGAVGSVTGNVGGNVVGSVGSVVGAVGSVTGLTASNLDATVSSRLASASISLSGGAVTVGTNNDKTGYALTAAYDAAKTAAQAGDAMALTSGERNSTADALLDRASGIETSYTPRQALRYVFAACAGVASGLETTTAVYKAGGNSGTTRITATVDANGNRSAVSLA